MTQTHLAWQTGQVGQVLDLLDETTPARMGGHDFRGFEWYYLRRLCQAGHNILARSRQAFIAVACSPDGKLLASVLVSDPRKEKKADRKPPALKLWDAVTGKELRTLEGYSPSSVMWESLAFSPDGKYLAAYGKHLADLGGRGIHIWDTSSGKVTQTFVQKGDRGGGKFAFSSDGRSLVVVSGKVIRRWDVPSGKETMAWLVPRIGSLTCVARTPDGERLVAGAGPGVRTIPSGGRSGLIPPLRVVKSNNESLRVIRIGKVAVCETR
jgi:WD40 repeat protein